MASAVLPIGHHLARTYRFGNTEVRKTDVQMLGRSILEKIATHRPLFTEIFFLVYKSLGLMCSSVHRRVKNANKMVY